MSRQYSQSAIIYNADQQLETLYKEKEKFEIRSVFLSFFIARKVKADGFFPCSIYVCIPLLVSVAIKFHVPCKPKQTFSSTATRALHRITIERQQLQQFMCKKFFTTLLCKPHF